MTGLCAGNSPEIGEFAAQMVSHAENVSNDDVIMIYKWFLLWNLFHFDWNFTKIVLRNLIDNMSVLVQVMAWWRKVASCQIREQPVMIYFVKMIIPFQ